jgi:uncharacterized lipoprotein YddW (UPF0748 family)
MDHVLGLSGGELPVDSLAYDAPERPQEIRALWVVRHALATESGVRDVVAAARENGFNTLFVQVRGRGETYYRSQIDPVARCLVPEPMEEADARSSEDDRPIIDLRQNKVEEDPRDKTAVEMTFDPLELLIDLAHLDGLEVHAWVNIYFTWSEGNPHPSEKHVINRHPEWITTDGDGVRLDYLSPDQLKSRWIEGLYLSPARPEVRRYLVDVTREIATDYRVDGIHLDYVRYPGRGPGIDEYSRERFLDEHGFDPKDFLTGPERGNLPVDTFWAKDLVGLWEEWRADQVTSLVSMISEEVRSCRPGVAISAAVRPDPARAAADFGQNWAAWLKNGYIDLAAPMLYSKSTPTFFSAVNSIKAALPDSLRDRVLAGIAVYNQGPRRAAEKIDVARAAGLGGFALFSYNAAAEWKKGQYLPSLRPKVMAPEGLDRTALGK